jgi:hypothetical protein
VRTDVGSFGAQIQRGVQARWASASLVFSFWFGELLVSIFKRRQMAPVTVPRSARLSGRIVDEAGASVPLAPCAPNTPGTRRKPVDPSRSGPPPKFQSSAVVPNCPLLKLALYTALSAEATSRWHYSNCFGRAISWNPAFSFYPSLWRVCESRLKFENVLWINTPIDQSPRSCRILRRIPPVSRVRCASGHGCMSQCDGRPGLRVRWQHLHLLRSKRWGGSQGRRREGSIRSHLISCNSVGSL